MDLDLTEAQLMLRKSAAEFLEKEFPRAVLREVAESRTAYSPTLWTKMANLGWMALAFPEECGGAGGSLVDLGLLIEEMGRAALLSPFLCTVVLGGITLLLSGDEGCKQKLIPRIAKGELLMTMALTEASGLNTADGIEQVTATYEGGKYCICGTKLFVDYAGIADYILCVVRTEKTDRPEAGVTVFVLPRQSPGISWDILQTIGPYSQYRVMFDNVAADDDAVLGNVHGAWRPVQASLEIATVLTCADMVGVAKRVLEMTSRHAQQRIQFGRPIADFQACRHQVADMATLVDGATLATYQALCKLNEGRCARREVSIAKAFANRACREVVLMAHHIIAGIGMMREHDLHFYAERAKFDELKFGGAHFHLGILAEELGLRNRTAQSRSSKAI